MSNNVEHDIPIAEDRPERPPSFWRSSAGRYLIGALVLGAVVLGYEHRAHILSSNWILWAPLLLCVGMHFFMHGGHGGHGGRGSGDDSQ